MHKAKNGTPYSFVDFMAFQAMQVRKNDQACHLGQGLSITWFVFSTSWSHPNRSDLDPLV